MPKRYGQSCPVAKTLELIGDRWTLLIVRDLLPGTRRFQDLLSSLSGIAPNILSDRLKLMEEHALVSRRLYSEHPPRAFIIDPKAAPIESESLLRPEGIVRAREPAFIGQIPAGYWMDGEYWGKTPEGDNDMAKEFAGQTIKLVPFWSHEKDERFTVHMEKITGRPVCVAIEEDEPLLAGPDA